MKQNDLNKRNLQKLIEENQNIIVETTTWISVIDKLSNNLNESAKDIENYKTNTVEVFKNIDKNSEIKIANFNYSLSEIFKKTTSDFDKQINNFFKKSKIKYYYLPVLCFFLAFVSISYIYFQNIRSVIIKANELASQNELIERRVNSSYFMLLSDKKHWYDEKNQKLFLEDKKWIQDYIKENKKK